MSVRYRWTVDVDENRLWVRELYTYVNRVFAQTEISGWNPRVRRFTPFKFQISASNWRISDIIFPRSRIYPRYFRLRKHSSIILFFYSAFVIQDTGCAPKWIPDYFQNKTQPQLLRYSVTLRSPTGSPCPCTFMKSPTWCILEMYLYGRKWMSF